MTRSGYQYNAIIGLGGIHHGPLSDTAARAAYCAELWKQELADTIYLAGGFPSLLPVQERRTQPTRARFMEQCLIRAGVDPAAIKVLDSSVTTIEDGLALAEVLKPGMETALVTSASHIVRATADLRHIFGPTIKVQPYASELAVDHRQQAQDLTGRVLSKLIFHNTEPGDLHGIGIRSQIIFPGKGSQRVFTLPQVMTGMGKALVHSAFPSSGRRRTS